MSDFFKAQLELLDEEPRFGGIFVEGDLQDFNQDLAIPFAEEEVYSPSDDQVPQPEEVPNGGIAVQNGARGTEIVDEEWGSLMIIPPVNTTPAHKVQVDQVPEERLPSPQAAIAGAPQLVPTMGSVPVQQPPIYVYGPFEQRESTHAIRHGSRPSPPSEFEEFNTQELASAIKTILGELSIKHSVFGSVLLKRAPGTLSTYLNKPVPYKDLSPTGRVSYNRMAHWRRLSPEMQIRIMATGMDHSNYSKLIGLPVVNTTWKIEKKAPRKVFNSEENRYLYEKFAQTPNPSRVEIQRMAIHLGLHHDTVHNFFMNRRNREFRSCAQ